MQALSAELELELVLELVLEMELEQVLEQALVRVPCSNPLPACMRARHCTMDPARVQRIHVLLLGSAVIVAGGEALVLAGEGATVANNTGITAMIALLYPSEPDARFLPQFLRGYPQEIKGVVGTLAAQSWGEHCSAFSRSFPLGHSTTWTCVCSTCACACACMCVCIWFVLLQTTWRWPARPHPPPPAVTGTPCPSPSRGCGEVWALGVGWTWVRPW